MSTDDASGGDPFRQLSLRQSSANSLRDLRKTLGPGRVNLSDLVKALCTLGDRHRDELVATLKNQKEGGGENA
jgi:hypothetical protein